MEFNQYLRLVYALGFDLTEQSRTVEYYSTRTGKSGCRSLPTKTKNIKIAKVKQHFDRTKIIPFSYYRSRTPEESVSYIENQKEKCIALTSHPGAKVLAIDIDYHENKDKLALRYDTEQKYQETDFRLNIVQEYLSIFLETSPLFVEVSRFRTGAHIYFATSDVPDQIFLTLLKQHLQDSFSDAFSFRTPTAALRLPGSPDYITQQDFQKAQPIDVKKIRTLLTGYSNLFDFQPGEINKIRPRVRHQSSDTKRQNFKEFCLRNYKIEAGNRVGGKKTLISMAMAAYHHRVPFAEFLETVYLVNQSSRDLSTKPRDWVEKDCRSIWRSCEKYYDPTRRPGNLNPCHNVKFISNRLRLKAKDRALAKRLLFRFLKSEDFRKVKSRNKNADHESILIQLEEMLGLSRYCQSLTNTPAFSLSATYRSRLREHYGLRHRDVRTLFFVLKRFLLGNGTLSIQKRHSSTTGTCAYFVLGVVGGQRIYYYVIQKKRKVVIDALGGTTIFTEKELTYSDTYPNTA